MNDSDYAKAMIYWIFLLKINHLLFLCRQIINSLSVNVIFGYVEDYLLVFSTDMVEAMP